MKKIENRVSVRKGFSDRNNLKPLNRIIQYDSFDDRTRNTFAIYVTGMIEHIKEEYHYESDLAKVLAINIFNEPISVGDFYSLNDVSKTITEVIKNNDYDEVLTIVELVAQMAEESSKHEYNDYDLNLYSHSRDEMTWFEKMNKVFEDEFVGYRFIGEEIQRITSQQEIESIQLAYSTRYDNVNQHIVKALDLMKVSGVKDYKNVIKECALALECLLNIVLNESGLELGKAINKYAASVGLHPAFKSSISNFYGFTSDSSGIRHDANTKDFKETFDEAKLILVQTSAFINYIIAKDDENKC